MNKRNVILGAIGVVILAVILVLVLGGSSNDQAASVLGKGKGKGGAKVSNSCVHAPATVVLSPATQTVSPGQSATYNLALTNNDDASCGTSSFNVTLYPEGNIGGPFPGFDFTIDYVDAAPGETVNKAVTVTPRTTATPGSYKFVYYQLNATVLLASPYASTEAYRSYSNAVEIVVK